MSKTTSETLMLRRSLRLIGDYVALKKDLIYYSDFGKLVVLSPTTTTISEALAHMLEEDALNCRPLRSALFVSKTHKEPSIAGSGFFEAASSIGIFRGDSNESRRRFWIAQMNRFKISNETLGEYGWTNPLLTYYRS